MSNKRFLKSWPQTYIRDKLFLMKGSGKMLSKIADYKGVIVFYLLLGLILLTLSYQSKIYDSRLADNDVNIKTNG